VLKHLFLLLSVLTLFAGFGGTAHADDPWRPKPPMGGLQAGATSDLPNVDRLEMQLAHSCPIQVPSSPGAAYSYSIVGITDTNYVVRMGYIVLQSDGANASCYHTPTAGSVCCSGWARWFVQVLRPDGSEAYWKISRRGEANPPPASSCSSGDGTCNGYPFSIGRVGNETWNFWFDWISKARVRVPGSGNTLKKAYYLAELSGTNGVAGGVLGPRTALTTYRYFNGTAWVEPGTAQSFYFNLTCNAPYGVESTGLGPPRSNGVRYHATAAGSGVTDSSCTNGILWP
jgi:hypothetical protein